ncbi:MAG: YfcE family phosphodiesterase [Chloroflexi bacterium]|nr:YfcE family phosphodiesterase [Chloroflexota bacterium]
MGKVRIGLISDTHIPEAGPELPQQVYRALRGVDLVLHAGDLHVLDVLDWLERLAPVLAARGNGDHPGGGRPGVPEDARIRPVHLLEIGGLTIGLVHAFPLPEDTPWTTPANLVQQAFGRRVDVIVCGDTHMECIAQVDGALLVNPGSPTLPHHLDGRLGHVAVLEIANGRAEARIIELARL